MPDAYQLFCMNVRQRFQQNAFNDAKNGCICADANGQRQQGHPGEQGRLQQAAQHVLQLVAEGTHTVEYANPCLVFPRNWLGLTRALASR